MGSGLDPDSAKSMDPRIQSIQTRKAAKAVPGTSGRQYTA
jgi:hypothetical protein